MDSETKRYAMLGRVIRFLVGVALLPISIGVGRALLWLGQNLRTDSGPVPNDAWWLVGGFGVWLLFYAVLPRPVRTYVLAHELTHALWAWAMGARVSKLKVGQTGGSVTLSHTNFLILLAPYFFPLYTMLFLALYGLLGLFYAVERYHLWWMGMIGLTWGFHITFTAVTLLQRQSDIRSCGRLFSYAFILLMNLLGIGLWVVAVTDATLENYVGHINQGVRQTLRESESLLSDGIKALNIGVDTLYE